MTDVPKPLIFDDDADPYFGNTKKTRANWRVAGFGPRYVKSGRKIAYHPDDIVAWVDANRRNTTSEIKVA